MVCCTPSQHADLYLRSYRIIHEQAQFHRISWNPLFHELRCPWINQIQQIYHE